MKDYGLVSIITAAYNSGRYIAKMIESVRGQSYTNWELLITDDGSADDTVQIIQHYVSIDSRINLLRNYVHLGAGAARNVSITEAKGRFLAFLDSDDMWMPEKLEKQLEFIDSERCAVCGTSYLLIDGNDKVYGIVKVPERYSFFEILFANWSGFSTCIIDTEKTGKMLLPTMMKRQDYGYLMLLLKSFGPALQIKEPLTYYRRRADSLSHNKFSLFRYHCRIYHDVLKWPMLFSGLFFSFCYLPVHLGKVIKIYFDSHCMRVH